MQVVQHRNNPASSPAMRGARRHWPLAHQQEGAAHTGMLSLVATQEAKECGGALMSKLQVCVPPCGRAALDNLIIGALVRL